MSASRLRVASVVVFGGLLAAGSPPATAQTDNGEWRSYGGDIANTRYSPLDQIDAGNFDDLEVAWRLRTANFGSEPEFNFQATPLMVDGVIYSTAGLRRAAIAADAGDRRAALDAPPRRGRAGRGRAAAPVGPRSGLPRQRRRTGRSSTSPRATGWSD